MSGSGLSVADVRGVRTRFHLPLRAQRSHHVGRLAGDAVGKDPSVSDTASSEPLHPPRRPGAVLAFGSGVGLVLGALLQIVGFGLVELDESSTFGAACEVAQVALIGGSRGLVVGLAAASGWLLVRRRQRSTLPRSFGAAVGAVVALAIVNLLIFPLTAAYLFSVCPY